MAWLTLFRSSPGGLFFGSDWPVAMNIKATTRTTTKVKILIPLLLIIVHTPRLLPRPRQMALMKLKRQSLSHGNFLGLGCWLGRRWPSPRSPADFSDLKLSFY